MRASTDRTRKVKNTTSVLPMADKLSAIGKKYARAELLQQILQPSAVILTGFETWVVQTTDGLVHVGFLRGDGEEVVIEDAIEGVSQPVCSRLPLAPGLEARLERGDDGVVVAHIELHSGLHLRIELPKGLSWRVEGAPYFPEFGREVTRSCLVGDANSFVRGRFRFSLG